MNCGKEEIFAPGEKFHGYVIERLLGNGGLGAVYLVRHEMLETLFALKVLYPDVAKENESYVKRFLREAKIATRIRHPNLVSVHDCGYDEGRQLYYLVMDYVKGGDLRQAIAFAGRFDPDRAVEVILQVASALEAAQKYHVVHRDIKPENIMVQPDGLVKLVDLGIAKSDDLQDSLNTSTETVFGTPAYVAPEQAIDAAKVDTRADIYSLGVVLFEMIAGKPPFDGPNAPQILAQTLSEDPFPDIRDHNANVNPMLAVLIRRMCVKERDRRIPDPTSLLAEFARIGYRPAPSAAAQVHYAPAADSATTVRSVRDLLAGLPKKADNTLSFKTDDVEIQTFVNGLKRKRVLRRWLTALAVGIALLLAVGVVLLLTGCSTRPPLVGRWGLKLPTADRPTGHLLVTETESNELAALVLWGQETPEPATVGLGEDNCFTVTQGGRVLDGRVDGRLLAGQLLDQTSGRRLGAVNGWRQPELPALPDRAPTLGEPINLLKSGLAGWKARDADATFGWCLREEGGERILANILPPDANGRRPRGTDLTTFRTDFRDFNLTCEVRVPEGADSGIFLRGRYEIQLADTLGLPCSTRSTGALYGRLAPVARAERKPGEWQQLSVTLYRQHLTVVLNGTTVLDRAPVLGVTAEALDAKEEAPGPICLQGSRSEVAFKNLLLRPCLD